jgi:hypothetical protein
VHFGDAASAAIVAVGLHVLYFEIRSFAFVNVALALVWILLNVGIARKHRKMVPGEQAEFCRQAGPLSISAHTLQVRCDLAAQGAHGLAHGGHDGRVALALDGLADGHAPAGDPSGRYSSM